MDNDSSQVDNSSQTPPPEEPVDVQIDPSSPDTAPAPELPPEPIAAVPEPTSETVIPEETVVITTSETPLPQPPASIEPSRTPTQPTADTTPTQLEPPADPIPSSPLPSQEESVAIPPPAPTPIQPVTETAPTPEPVAPVPEPISQLDYRAKIHALSDEELRYAATYYLQKNQKTISAKGVEARKQQMETNLNTIFMYLTAHGESPLPRIAKHINCSPGTTSHYLQLLIKRGQISATGWASQRLYKAN